ncbi:YCF48-related protein [Pandoraea sp. PE-S2R-1]|uniref:WD40/YVTN/BNR-like repeat-containing protein n=1 Tax=Pandoraea sp. PE-S2R-1 TaxID=1986994 RepID=UPI000B402EE3|nr:YCF48-related protein [Pandoraea sp. PE-S2R-1]
MMQAISGRRARAVALCVAMAASGFASVAHVAAAQAATLDVLERPALRSARAATSVMLALAHAGKRIVAVGERGIAIWSDDDGRHWQQAQVPVSVSLTALTFVDASHGWAVGHGGVVLHSDDGGMTWQKQLDGVQAASLLLAAAKDGQPGAGSDPRAALANAQRLVAEGPGKPFLDVYAFDARNVLIVGAFGLAFATQDGGASWAPALDRIDNPQGKHLYAIRRAAAKLFIVGEQGAVFRSDDGGAHFTTVTTPYAGTYFGALSVPDSTVVVYGLRGNVYWSDDAGGAWRKSELAGTGTIAAGLRLASGTLVLLDDSGRLLRSDDAGHSFTAADVPQSSPYTGAVETSDGALVLSGVRGMTRIVLDSHTKAKSP